MPHHVYANDNEIATNSADGKSAGAAPDVCMSPPGPPAGPVPVTYANTVYAKDITNGSRTVFIKGGEIALEDVSYFSTSTGNEGATNAFAKGIVSGVIKGRAHFASWSPNVKVEGLSVTRHLDLVTHNHANPGNALTQRYQSVFSNNPACANARRKIQKKCAPERDERRPRAKKRGLLRTLGNIATLPDSAIRRTLGYSPGRDNQWIDDHCDGLWAKPTAARAQDLQNQINELMEIAQDPTAIISRAMGEILEMAYEHLSWWYLARKLLWLGGRSVAKTVVGALAAGTGVGVVVTAAMAAWTVSDVISTAKDIAEKLGPDAMEHLDDLMNIQNIQDMAQQKLDEYAEDPMSAMADAQSLAAQANPCVRARRCQLVPYNKTGSRTAARTGEGCCPGQTGHHLIPGEVTKGQGCYPGTNISDSKGYRNAPTICLEGVNNSHGTHGVAHTEMYDSVEDFRVENNTDTISYDEIRDKAINSVTEPPPNAPASGCNKACLRAQLDGYYEECKDNENLPALSGSNSSHYTPAPTTGDGRLRYD